LGFSVALKKEPRRAGRKDQEIKITWIHAKGLWVGLKGERTLMGEVSMGRRGRKFLMNHKQTRSGTKARTSKYS